VKYELVSTKLVTLWVLFCWNNSSCKEQFRERRKLRNKKKKSNLMGISFPLVPLRSGNFELICLNLYVMSTRVIFYVDFIGYEFVLVCAFTGYLHA